MFSNDIEHTVITQMDIYMALQQYDNIKNPKCDIYELGIIN